jgi:uncharacterized protein involved in type VI secretion and phage assembly
MNLNTALFECQFGHFPRDFFHVLSVNGQNDGFSQCYHYCIELSVPRHIDAASLAPLPVQLFICPEKTSFPSSTKPHLVTKGNITRYEKYMQRDLAVYHLKIWVEPWFVKLRRKVHSRVFVDKTPEEITERILTENQIPLAMWCWHAPDASDQANAEPLSLLLQIEENDADFLQRLWAKQGYAFVFDCTESTGVLHIAGVDKLPLIVSNTAQEKALTYHAQKGMARQPNHAFDWAYVVQENTMPVLTLKTLAQDIHPGHRIQFTEPEHAWLSGEYLVIERKIIGNFRRLDTELDYCCTLDLIPVKILFILPSITAPVYAGLWTARIDNGNTTDTVSTEKPNLDKAGDYWIRFPFDTTTIPTGPGSNRVRFATPFGGNGYGWHFPLRDGTQVVLTLRDTTEGGHEATIVGTLPDAQTPAPMDPARPSCHRLRTHRENTFEADDNVDTGYTALFTHHRDNEVRLSANTHDNSILLKSKKQAIHLSAHADITIESQQNIHIHAKQDLNETIDNTYTLSTQGDIQIKTGDMAITCAKESRVMSKTDSKINTKTLRWSAKKIFSLKILDNMHCWVEHCHLTAENITLKATSDAPFVLAQGEAQCHFDASGNMGLYANQIFIEAPLISIYSSGEQNR